MCRASPSSNFAGYAASQPTASSNCSPDDFGQPNGLCFSPDGAVLYVNDTEARHIRVYSVGVDGSLSGGNVFAELTGDEPGAPDGMKVDAEGNVWCTGPGGSTSSISPARLVGVLRVPETVGNFAWGGATRHDLYICATTSLYRLRTVGHRGHRPH